MPIARRWAAPALALCLAWPVFSVAQEARPAATTADGGRYFGTLQGGRLHGKGRIEWRNGARYEGEFADGLMSGQGVMRFANGDSYDGEFRDGRKYRGEFLHGRYSGEGRLETGSGESFEGRFVDGEFTGKGFYTRPDGAHHEGLFVKWRSSGPGTYTDQQGNVFEGNFTNNELNGRGRLRGKLGFLYEGEFKAWRFHGKGVLRLANGDEYSGSFANGQYQGEGTLRYAKPRDDGRMEDRGTWREGRFEDEAARQLAMRNVELALYSQRSILDKALDSLAPREAGRINMYLMALGGDGGEEVFRREAAFVREQFDRDYGTRNRSLALVNSRNSVTTTPMATVTSIRESFKAIAAKMNREEDILFLFLTSHGSKEHELVLNQSNMGLRSLPARELGELLRESGIGWKVIVISACYSGGFIEHLKDERTLVIAAARHDRASFGCEDDSSFTYFGRAYFKESLPSSGSFEEAFSKADALVREWELRDFREAKKSGAPEFSYPQIYQATPINAHLRRWWAQRQGK